MWVYFFCFALFFGIYRALLGVKEKLQVEESGPLYLHSSKMIFSKLEIESVGPHYFGPGVDKI